MHLFHARARTHLVLDARRGRRRRLREELSKLHIASHCVPSLYVRRFTSVGIDSRRSDDASDASRREERASFRAYPYVYTVSLSMLRK